MSEIKQCFFCNEQATYNSPDPLNMLYYIDCPNCGSYTATGKLLDLGDIKKYAPYKHLISGVIREKNDLGLTMETITIENVEGIAEDPIIPRTVKQQLNKLILNMYSKTHFFGDIIGIAIDYYAVGYAKNTQELGSLINVLKEMGYVNGSFLTGEKFRFKAALTLRGINTAEELLSSNVNSNKVFVAMGFADDLLKAHSEAIKPACKKCGFEAFLISEKEHNEGITDRIIAEIKTSKFVITDFTYNNNGAYFEAGFAQGRGLKVIRTCKKDWFDKEDEQGNKINKVHFDINHYNFILWEDYADLKERLINRIRATIL